ncbi:MAG: HAD-IB family hydrolase [Epulopiscium sp.]|nr:HAD-IB family hydrolase [Candidatus Epulonipiscium sp.]
MKNVAAFFDIDGTIYREGLIKDIFKKMINYELIEESKWYREVRPAFISWDKREGTYDNYLQKMVDAHTEAVKGTNPIHMEYLSKKVIEQKGDRVHTFSRGRISWHKENGHKVIAISGSPIELVKEMSEKYKMDDYRGTTYKLDEEGNYSGEIIPMWDSRSKRKAIDELVEQYNIDIDKSYAYGDTAGDFSMLKMVGNPVAINPTKELLNKIIEDKELKEKIKIVVERKDVVYVLDVNCLDFS